MATHRSVQFWFVSAVLGCCCALTPVFSPSLHGEPEADQGSVRQWEWDAISVSPPELKVAVLKDDHLLPVEDYERVVRDFEICLTLFLRPEYLPSHRDVVKEIRLVPSTDGCKMDLAILDYDLGKVHFMVVQSGGVGGRFWFFVRNSDILFTAENQGSASVNADLLMRTFLNEEAIAGIHFTEAEWSGQQYVAQAVTQRVGGNRVNRASLWANRGEACLSVRKPLDACVNPGAAHVPMPDRWFSSLRKIAGPKPETQQNTVPMTRAERLELMRALLDELRRGQPRQ